MTLEEYVDKHLVRVNELMTLIGQPLVTAETLRERGLEIEQVAPDDWKVVIPAEDEEE